MELTLIEKAGGKWCIHTAEGDLHVGGLIYRGPDDWMAEVMIDLERHEDQQWALVAGTFDEAREAAFEKVRQYGVIDALEAHKAQHGHIPSADEVEEVTNVNTDMFENIMIGVLQSFFIDAKRNDCLVSYMQSLTTALGHCIGEIATDPEKLRNMNIDHLDMSIRKALAARSDTSGLLDALRKTAEQFTGASVQIESPSGDIVLSDTNLKKQH